MRRLLLLLALALPVAAQRPVTTLADYGIFPNRVEKDTGIFNYAKMAGAEFIGSGGYAGFTLNPAAGGGGAGSVNWGFLSGDNATGREGQLWLYNLTAGANRFIFYPDGNFLAYGDIEALGTVSGITGVFGSIRNTFLADSTIGSDVRLVTSTSNGTLTPNTVGAPIRGKYYFPDTLSVLDNIYFTSGGGFRIGVGSAFQFFPNGSTTSAFDIYGDGVVARRASIDTLLLETLKPATGKVLVALDSAGRTDTLPLAAGGLYVESVAASGGLLSSGGQNPEVSIDPNGSFTNKSVTTDTVQFPAGAFTSNDTAGLYLGDYFLFNYSAYAPLMRAQRGYFDSISVAGFIGVLKAQNAEIKNMGIGGCGMFTEDVGLVYYSGCPLYMGSDFFAMKNITIDSSLTVKGGITQPILAQMDASLAVPAGTQVVYTSEAFTGNQSATLLAAAAYGSAGRTYCVEFSDAYGALSGGTWSIFPSGSETIEGAAGPGSPLVLNTPMASARLCRAPSGAAYTWFIAYQK